MTKGTVPQGNPPNNNSAEVPQQVQVGGAASSAIPSKPSAKTGPGGPGVSIPKVGKGGA